MTDLPECERWDWIKKDGIHHQVYDVVASSEDFQKLRLYKLCCDKYVHGDEITAVIKAPDYMSLGLSCPYCDPDMEVISEW